MDDEGMLSNEDAQVEASAVQKVASLVQQDVTNTAKTNQEVATLSSSLGPTGYLELGSQKLSDLEKNGLGNIGH
jgi:hypothetical protein